MAFWEFAAFIANSLIFLLIGVTVAGIPFSRLGLTALVVSLTALKSAPIQTYRFC
jgi:Na+:H+ antiporter